MRTPGPWTVTRETDDDGEEITYVGTPEKRGVDGNDYRLGNAARHVCKVYDWSVGSDAALIAAAPDLLESLRETVADLESAYDDGEGARPTAVSAVIRRAAAAIAKAEGRQP